MVSSTDTLVVIDVEMIVTYLGVSFIFLAHSLLSLKSNAKL